MFDWLKVWLHGRKRVDRSEEIASRAEDIRLRVIDQYLDVMQLKRDKNVR